MVADLNKRGVAECFEEYGLRDYFDQYGQRRFCNLSMSVAARRHPQVSRAFGSTSQHLNDRKTQNLFSAIAYRKASAMIEQDRQAHREQREVQFRGLTHAERYRTADVRRRQLQLILSGFPNLQDAQVPFLPAGMTEEVFQPVEATSRQQERDDRKRCERHNVYLAERNPQTVFLVKRQGWIFSYDDVLSIWEKLDDWMGAISLTPLWGLDRSTFSQFLVDLSLIDKDHLPHVWAHQVFDAYAKPTRLAAGDPDYDEPPDGRERAALCVSRWDFMHVLDRLLRTRFDLSPREEFLSRLRAAYNHLRRDWKAREEDSKIAAQASEHKWQAWKQLLGNVQVMQQTVAQRFGGSKSARGTTKFKSTVKPIKDDGRIKESLRWKFDRHVSCMLKEPEVMKMVEQFREVFSTIFDCYASQREKRHMAEVDLVSLCYDLCLVPDLAPRHEVHRVYMMAECLDKHPTPSLASSLTSDLSNVSTLSVPSRGSFKDAGVKKSSKPKLKTSMAEVVKSKRKLIHGMTKSEKSISSSLKFEGADFGVGALAECLCRIVFGHLLVYGNSLQQIMSSEARFVWLISYLVHVLRQDRAGESKGSMPDWPGWRGRAWTSLLERLRDEDFRNATPPMAQAAPVEMDGLRRATSHRPAAHHNSDTEDEGSPDKEQRAPQTFELPSFAKDAPDLSNWLFAKLLVCPIDIMAHKNRGSRTDKPRKTTSRPAH